MYAQVQKLDSTEDREEGLRAICEEEDVDIEVSPTLRTGLPLLTWCGRI